MERDSAGQPQGRGVEDDQVDQGWDAYLPGIRGARPPPGSDVEVAVGAGTAARALARAGSAAVDEGEARPGTAQALDDLLLVERR